MAKTMYDLRINTVVKDIVIKLFGENDIERASAKMKPGVAEYIENEIASKIDPLMDEYLTEKQTNGITKKLYELKNAMDHQVDNIRSAAIRMQF